MFSYDNNTGVNYKKERRLMLKVEKLINDISINFPDNLEYMIKRSLATSYLSEVVKYPDHIRNKVVPTQLQRQLNSCVPFNKHITTPDHDIELLYVMHEAGQEYFFMFVLDWSNTQ